MESIAKTMSVVSTRTTVAQKSVSPRNVVAAGWMPFPSEGRRLDMKCLNGR